MLFEEKVHEVEFVKRYKRFFADVKHQGAVLTAHVPNTGSLKTCLFEGSKAIITESNNPARKLKATLQFLQTPTGWVGVNTSLPNLLVHEAWQNGLIADWHQYKVAQREYKISKESRLDLVLAADAEALTSKDRLHFIEVKNVTYREGDTALFPDAVTERGQKHLLELMRLKKEGHSCEIVFVIQREGCTRFAPAENIDPEYTRLLKQAQSEGVIIRPLTCVFDPLKGIEIKKSAHIGALF